MKKNLILALLVAMALVGCHNNTPKNEEKKTETEAVVSYDSPEALFEAIGVSMSTQQDPQHSIAMVNQLVTDYPSFENNPVALFMLASFVYDEQLHDLDKARETYQRVIDEYPGTPFANDAAIAITQLGMTPDELVRMFEEQAE